MNIPSDTEYENCPIHKWINVEKYLAEASVPEHLWETFHELVQARGTFPRIMSNSQGQQFGRMAVGIIDKHNIQPLEAQGLRIIFGQLIGQWLSTNATNN